MQITVKVGNILYALTAGASVAVTFATADVLMNEEIEQLLKEPRVSDEQGNSYPKTRSLLSDS